MKAKGGYIYIVSNVKRSVLYIGVTSDLYTRIYEHKQGIGSAFTKKYNCKYLLYYEFFEDIESAILKEKQLKIWKREWKENLIARLNPEKRDLFNEIAEFR